MSREDYSRYRRALSGKDFPLAYVDLERFDRNLGALGKRAHRLPIRLATKSLRCLSLIRRALDHAQFSGVLAYSGFEAAMLAEAGVEDIVLGYPVVQPSEIEAAVLAKPKGSPITFMTDLPEHLELLARAADRHRVEIPIALDIDLSERFPGLHFGVRRSFVDREARLAEYLRVLAKYPRLKLEGAMGYEAQIAGVADSNPAIVALKKFSILSARKKRQLFVSQIQDAGHRLRFVNGGGTGSFESTRLDPSVTELAAGSGLYSPTLFDGYRDFRHEPSLGFALLVSRKPAPEIATCFSGGVIASGQAGVAKLPTPVYPEGLSLLPHEGAGEVQTPVSGRGARDLSIGDPVFFRPAKAGEACERFDELHLISGDRIVETAKTYRGQGRNFG